MGFLRSERLPLVCKTCSGQNPNGTGLTTEYFRGKNRIPLSSSSCSQARFCHWKIITWYTLVPSLLTICTLLFGKKSSPVFSTWKLSRVDGPFAEPGHMVRNKLHWDANNAVGLRKQKNSYQSSRPARLSFVPLRHLRPRVIYSVPCDRILQRADCQPFFASTVSSEIITLHVNSLFPLPSTLDCPSVNCQW